MFFPASRPAGTHVGGPWSGERSESIFLVYVLRKTRVSYQLTFSACGAKTNQDVKIRARVQFCTYLNLALGCTPHTFACGSRDQRHQPSVFS